MKDFSTITSKGQITLPQKMRAALNLQAGIKVQLRLEGKAIHIEAVTDIEDLRQRNQRHLKTLKKSKEQLIREEEQALEAGILRRTQRTRERP